MRRTSSVSAVALALVTAVFAAATVASCAQGTEDNGGGDDDDPRPDANVHVVIDAPPLPIDAPLPIDSSLPIDAPLPIDAAVPPDGGGGLVCTTSSQCNQGAGECCWAGFGVCFPDPGIPGTCL